MDSMPISKDSTIRLGLVILIVSGVIAVAMYASRMMSAVERASEDIGEIRTIQKEQWVFTQRIYESVIRNGERINGVDARLLKVEGRDK